MKNAFRVLSLVFSAALLAAGLSACSIVTGSTKSSSDTGSALVTGRLSLGGKSGATSSSVLASLGSAGAARSAITSFSEAEYQVYAYQSGDENYPGTVNEDMTYSVELTATGDWTIVVSMWAPEDEDASSSHEILYGSNTVTVDSDFSPITSNISVYPAPNENVSGSIRLPLTDSTGKIKSVTVREDKENVTTADFTNGSALISVESIAPGTHEVKLDFTDENGNILYFCREVFTVFSALTTDSWFGEGSSYITYDAASGGYVFTLTEELLSAYGADVLPTTPTALYSCTDGVYSYYLVDDGTTINAESNAGLFCFDADGNFYTANTESTSVQSIVMSTAKLPSEGVTLPVALTAITVDRKTNIFYGMSDSLLYEYPSLIPEEGGEPDISDVVTYSLLDESGSRLSSSVFALYDGVLYIPLPSLDDDEHFTLGLATASLSDGVTSESAGVRSLTLTSTALDVTGLEYFSEDTTVTDCLYQDDALYVLVRDVGSVTTDSWNQAVYSQLDQAVYSQGAVIKIRLFDKVVSVLGAGDGASLSPTDIKYMYTYSYHPYVLYGDNSLSSKFLLAGNEPYTSDTTCNSLFPTVYAPTTTLESDGSDSSEITLSATAFYGPRKFIAIKPKELVIADDGCAFYIDGSAALAFKNANRVVTVDLEKFSITSAQDAGQTLEKDASDRIAASYIVPDGSYYYSSGSYYYMDDNGSSSAYTDNVFLGIPCEE